MGEEHGDERLPQPGDTIAGHYQIESMLGRGGMGAVFAARNLRTQRAVALKWMLPQAASSPDAVARFLAEARATARIEHPNVVHIYDFGEEGGSPYLVMERLRGESLRERLDRMGKLGPAETIEVLVPAMRGVAEAHREGIIHRDIKPDNIFLCQGKDGTPRPPKVVDFGISKLYAGDANSNLTGTGMMMGTPSYMSPEQLNNPSAADVRFDVYAFGVVLFETLTGRCPYVAEGIFQLVGMIMSGEPARPSELVTGLPPALDEVVLRAMHRDVEVRYASLPELAAALEGLGMSAGAGSAPGLVPAIVPAAVPATVPMADSETPSSRPIPATAVGTPMPSATLAMGASPSRPPLAQTAVLGQGGPASYPPPAAPSYPPTPATASYPPHAYTPAPHAPAGLHGLGTQAGFGGHTPAPNSAPTGHPHVTPYGASTPAPASSSGLGKLIALGALAMLLGGGTAAGAWYFYAGPGASLFEAGPAPVAAQPPPEPAPVDVAAPEPTTSTLPTGVVAPNPDSRGPDPANPDPTGTATRPDPANPDPTGTATQPDPANPDSTGTDPADPDTRTDDPGTSTTAPSRPSRRRRRVDRPAVPDPVPEPVVRPLAPAPQPVQPPSPPRPQQGTNGAMIIE